MQKVVRNAKCDIAVATLKYCVLDFLATRESGINAHSISEKMDVNYRIILGVLEELANENKAVNQNPGLGHGSWLLA